MGRDPIATELPFPGAWVWLLAPAYTLHIAEELFVGAGFYTWVGRFVEFSRPSFLFVNFMMISLIAAGTWLARSGGPARVLVVGIALHFAIHAVVVHPASSVGARHFSPGLASGILVLLPMAVIALRRSARALRGAEIGLGVATGMLLFASQDLWRVLFNAWASR